MSIFSAMYAGVSGLDAESSALGVIGNNLSNSSTVGFKESREEFDTVLGAAAGTEGAIGGGVEMTSAQEISPKGPWSTRDCRPTSPCRATASSS